MSTRSRVALAALMGAMLGGMIACDVILTVPGLTFINCMLGLAIGLATADLWQD